MFLRGSSVFSVTREQTLCLPFSKLVQEPSREEGRNEEPREELSYQSSYNDYTFILP